MKVTGEIKDLTASQGTLAKALGVSRQRVGQLIKEGIVITDPNSTNGQVLVFDSIKNYFSGRQVKGENGEVIDYMEEKAKHEKVKREIAELKLAKYEGSVYDATTVEMVFIEMTTMLRSQLLGLPTKLAPVLEGKKKEDIYQLMTEEIEGKLLELGEYNPDLFKDEVEAADVEDSE